MLNSPPQPTRRVLLAASENYRRGSRSRHAPTKDRRHTAPRRVASACHEQNGSLRTPIDITGEIGVPVPDNRHGRTHNHPHGGQPP